MHQTFNGLELKELYYAHSRGTKWIDSIVATPNIRNHSEGIRLFKTNEIMNADHRSHVVDINLEEDFQEEFSGWDKIVRRVLDPRKRPYSEKCNEHVDEMLASFPLESTMQKPNASTVTKKELEHMH